MTAWPLLTDWTVPDSIAPFPAVTRCPFASVLVIGVLINVFSFLLQNLGKPPRRSEKFIHGGFFVAGPKPCEMLGAYGG
jgi:hypothetical protein